MNVVSVMAAYSAIKLKRIYLVFLSFISMMHGQTNIKFISSFIVRSWCNSVQSICTHCSSALMSFMKIDAENTYYSVGRKWNYIYPTLKIYYVLKIKNNTLVSNLTSPCENVCALPRST